MFKFAQSIVRHKVGVVAVIAFAVFVFSRDAGEGNGKPASPWSHQASAAAAPSRADDSIINSAVAKASDLIGETTGIDPEELTEHSVGNFNKTNEAYGEAKKN